MRISCGRILVSANCTRIFGMGRRKRTACAVRKTPLTRAGNGDTDHGARAFADGWTAQAPCRRDAGADAARRFGHGNQNGKEFCELRLGL